MFVQRVVMPGSRRESWTVLGDVAMPVGPVERFLAYLTDIERSPNTVKAYAHDLKDWFVFLAARGLDWREVRLEDVGEFVAWLRLPLPARDGGERAAVGGGPLRRRIGLEFDPHSGGPSGRTIVVVTCAYGSGSPIGTNDSAGRR